MPRKERDYGRTPSSSYHTGHSSEPKTLAEMLFPLLDPAEHRELEEFRIKFEEVHGPTDLTLRYTSTWPEFQQDWLIKHQTKQYFDGLPPFAKAFLHGKMKLAAQSGTLDNMPDNFLRLFVSGGMDSNRPARGR